ncbi:hypothetical protein COL154_013937 [Colletotrichum chrysophilum]|nr:hypothetical protein COL154_013937 [Colletotrichum chrysophilum]
MRIVPILLVLCAAAGAAHAGDISSAYSDLDWKKECAIYASAGSGDGDWADLACSGYRGYPVLIAYDDERESLFYGFPPDDMTPVWESFTAFNSSTAKMEWRIETNGDVAVPFAAIHRRSVSKADNPEQSVEVLVVSKVAQPDREEGCSVGLVLATGNPQANDQPPKIADETAKDFQCGKDRRATIGRVPDFGRVDN